MRDLNLHLTPAEGVERLKWEWESERTHYPDLLGFGTADMDYQCPGPILDALSDVIKHGHLGYPMVPDEFYQAIHDHLLKVAGWDIDARTSVAQNVGIYTSSWSVLETLTKPGEHKMLGNKPAFILNVALNEIRDEMLRIFNEGFEKINENFKQTFKELFGGGRAELQLDYTDCEDPLDAGVEIVACPPGKKLTKISLLSGGERALTAIAILFAIIGMRPMPFCVLDEIEAALDEANVGRYGVSKIVSVKLSEVQARLGGDTVV